MGLLAQFWMPALLVPCPYMYVTAGFGTVIPTSLYILADVFTVKLCIYVYLLQPLILE